MSRLTSGDFWDDAATRAVRTVAQTAVALIPAASMFSQVDWLVVTQTSLIAGLLSLLNSIKGTGDYRGRHRAEVPADPGEAR